MIARKGKKQCRDCDTPVGPRSTLFCEYHAGYNAGHSVAFMRYHRNGNPKYREKERLALKKRMRKLRAERRKAGLNNRGQPYKSQIWARRAVDREGVSAS
jgi:hypothetical protein